MSAQAWEHVGISCRSLEMIGDPRAEDWAVLRGCAAWVPNGASLVPGGTSPSGYLDDSNPGEVDEEDQLSQTPISLSELSCVANKRVSARAPTPLESFPDIPKDLQLSPFLRAPSEQHTYMYNGNPTSILPVCMIAVHTGLALAGPLVLSTTPHPQGRRQKVCDARGASRGSFS